MLCTTSTLALGVNLPAHLVIIKSTRRWSAEPGEVSGYKEYDRSICLQMIGRRVLAALPDLPASECDLLRLFQRFLFASMIAFRDFCVPCGYLGLPVQFTWVWVVLAGRGAHNLTQKASPSS